MLQKIFVTNRALKVSIKIAEINSPILFFSVSPFDNVTQFRKIAEQVPNRIYYRSNCRIESIKVFDVQFKQ